MSSTLARDEWCKSGEVEFSIADGWVMCINLFLGGERQPENVVNWQEEESTRGGALPFDYKLDGKAITYAPDTLELRHHPDSCGRQQW